jgi:rubrerythrin
MENTMPNGFKTFAEVISFAVMREDESYRFYMDLSARADDPFIQELFTDFAEEELRHKKTLMNLDVGGMERIFAGIVHKIDDLNVAKTLAEITPASGMNFKDLLVIAIKREEISQRLYSFLAETTDDNDVSLLFVGLAKEEAKHKLRIEKTYKQFFVK